MARRKRILIGCPQHRKLVRGTYECGPDGDVVLGPGGQFLLGRVRCGQDGGRCMQALCVLHRYNRRGPGSWYPDRVLAMPETCRRNRTRRGRRSGSQAPDPPDQPTLSFEA